MIRLNQLLLLLLLFFFYELTKSIIKFIIPSLNDMFDSITIIYMVVYYYF